MHLLPHPQITVEYGKIEGLKKPVPRILLGTSTPAFSRGEDMSELLDAAFAAGVTAFDTARRYGKAERILGAWMRQRGNREQVVLLTKGGHPSLLGRRRVGEKAVRRDLEASLQALGTQSIDIYLLHRDDPRKPVDGAVELLNALHAEGKIGAFGGSNWTHRRIEEANEYAYRRGLVPFTVSSPYFRLADMEGDPFLNGAVGISGPNGEEARGWYEKTGMPVVAYSVLGRGFFSGRVRKASDLHGWVRRAFATEENFERLRRARELAQRHECSPARIALAWMLAQPVNGFAVVSASRAERLEDDLAAFSLALTAEELAYLDLR